MAGGKIPILAARGFLLLCAIIILAVAADGANFLNSDRVQDLIDRLPDNFSLDGIIPKVEFSAFVGAWGILQALVGMASAFVEAIPWIAMAAIDGLAALFYLAAGIVRPALFPTRQLETANVGW